MPKTSAPTEPAPLPFCRPVLCWTERQAEVFASILIRERVPFVFAGDGESTRTIDFLFRGADYPRACELAQSVASI